LSAELLRSLATLCHRFLVVSLDRAGTCTGPDLELVQFLSEAPVMATYAGGIRELSDLDDIFCVGQGRVDFSVNSALHKRGSFSFQDVAAWRPSDELRGVYSIDF
jgi:phosphoribosylformimino-5-aminoimidazole carboxamide ribotide isomerase